MGEAGKSVGENRSSREVLTTKAYKGESRGGGQARV
jgi:hypothetical protein